MTLMPVDGILEVVAKVAETDQDAADELVRIGLYEATCDQIDAMSPRLATDMAQFVVKRCAVGRQALYRLAETAVSKAETDSLTRQLEYLDTIEAQAMELVTKGPLTWLGWNQENPKHKKNQLGRWVAVDEADTSTPTTDVREGAFDVLHGITGKPGANALAYSLPVDREGKARSQTENARAWNAEPGRGRSYRRLSMTGDALRQASLPGTTGYAVGSLAQLVGQLGPEAEKVLGPGIARTAYRYRGTEKRPDPDLIGRLQPGTKAKVPGAMDRANASLAARTGKDVASADQEEARLRDANLPVAPGRKRELDPVDSIAAHHVGVSGLSPDQVAMRTRGDVVADYLIKKLPDARTAAISMKAGEVPPSQGVIIDAEGEVLSEAQGFNGDHYLPFDLKNLRGLQGGQYVRTRVTGGPTTEDIYTGLLTGARQVQVVSNSGVFTVEFDPSLRGGRRYSDKARRMIGRYERLLDTIQSGELYRVDVPEPEKRKMKQEALRSQNWDPVAGQTVYNQALERKRAELAFGKDEDELADEAEEQIAEAESHGQGFGSAQSRARAKAEVLRELKDENQDLAVRQYQLDGQGYAAALSALQQEFPYYLRPPVFEPLPEFLEARSQPTGGRKRRAGRDKGYVEYGENKATGLGRGFYSETARGNLYHRGEAPAAVTTGTERAGRAPAAAEAATAAAPVQGPVTSPIAEGTVPFDQVIAPGAQAPRELARSLKGSIYALDNINLEHQEIAQSESEDDAIQEAPLVYAKWKIGKVDDPQQLADWLLHNATPHQRTKFLAAVKQIPGVADSIADPMISAVFDDAKAQAAKVEEIAALAGAFAPQLAETVALAEPSVGDPRPQPLPDILALGNVPENYDRYLENAANQVPDLAEAIEALAKAKSQDAIADVIGNAVRETKALDPTTPGYQQNLSQLEDMQRAWAFVKARQMAGGAAPFGKAAPAPLSPFQRALQLHLSLLGD